MSTPASAYGGGSPSYLRLAESTTYPSYSILFILPAASCTLCIAAAAMFLRRSSSKDLGSAGKSSSSRSLFGRTSSVDSQDGQPEKPSIFRAFSFSRSDSDKASRRPSGSEKSKAEGAQQAAMTADGVKRKEVYLQFALRRRNRDLKWDIVSLKLETEGDGRFAVVSQGDNVVDRIPLSITSFIMETNVAPLSFAIVADGRIEYFQAPKDLVVVVWLEHFRKFVRECSPYPFDPFYREALLRQVGESYDVKFLVKQRLGVVFDRSQDWAYIKVAEIPELGIEVGSVLAAINGSLPFLHCFNLKEFIFA